MNKLSHTDADGNARLVNIGEKPEMKRMAKATGKISLCEEVRELIKENKIKKGSVLAVAEIAGIQAAKQTSLLIPLCHNLLLEDIRVKTILTESGITVESEIYSCGKTGVEMEAITAVSIALLTIYDMCKAVDKNMVLDGIMLKEKIKERKK